MHQGCLNISKMKEGYVISFSKLWDMRYILGYGYENSDLSGDQIIQILEALSMSGNIVAYSLSGVDLSRVPEDLLASLAISCRELSIANTKLSTGQLSAILHTVQSHYQNTLEELDIREKNLKYVQTKQKTGCIAAQAKMHA